MKLLYPLFIVALFLIGCASTPTPVPTEAAPTDIPTTVPQPTQAPTNTALPPTPTRAAPTNTALPPTNTPIPVSPTATATSTALPVTRPPQPTVVLTPTATIVALKYSAPALIEPRSGETRVNGSDDLVLRWNPVAALGSDECYLVTVRITNTVDNQYAEQSFIAENTCNDAGTGPVTFTLRKRAPAPDYAGLVAIASGATPSTSFRVTWQVVVVQNRGADPNKPDPGQYTPVSPVSETFEFGLNG